MLLLVIPAAHLSAQYNPTLAEDYLMYSCHWNGSTASPVAFSVSVPDSTSANKFTHPVGFTVVATQALVVTIRTRAATAPTATLQLPVKLNTNEDPPFRCYSASNVSTDGDIVTVYPMAAGETQTFVFSGMRFQKGVTTRRNVTVHLGAAASGTAYVTALVGSK